MHKQFKIGTRASLLARTQCTLLKNLLEKSSGASFELNFIQTQGDQQTDKPLWQLEGNNFFTKELDSALINNEVDLVVHSYKDLGSIRPKELEIAAISKREFAEDILLIKKENIKKLKNKDKLFIGTSSPRRIANIEYSLKDFIPVNPDCEIQCKMLRGNVNTRIQKLQNNEYDAIVLAMAGLERLCLIEESKQELVTLLDGLDFMILPQKDFPTAASQGALAVEINKNSPRYEEILNHVKKVHDSESAQLISKEREVFNSYGGGCHLAVGIHVLKVNGQCLQIEKGLFKDKRIESVINLTQKAEHLGKVYKFIGNKDTLIIKKAIKQQVKSNQNLFVTSKYCFHSIHEPKTLWAAGSQTHKRLVSLGHWVHASADGMGHNRIMQYQKSKLIELFLGEDKSIITLSHDKAQSILGAVFACYQRQIKKDASSINFDQIDTCFWSSFYQYEQYLKVYPELKHKKHACGLGKTYDQFLKHKISVIPIARMSTL